MDLMNTPTGSADPVAEVRRLRRELRRERARRRAAESVEARAGAELYDSVREMRTVQADLLDHPDQPAVVHELHQALTEDLASGQLVNRAAESVGRAIGADRCEVLPVDARRYSSVQGTWSGSAEVARLPRASSFVDLPEPLTALLIEAAQRQEPLQIDHVDDDPRLGHEAAAEIVEAMGVRSMAAVPVAMGEEVVGWVIVQSVVPRRWEPRELAVCSGLSHDLVSSLMQVRAFEQQRESMQRLRELDRAKDSFISTVSHELRTPLTSIVGYLEVMNEGTLGELPRGVSVGLSVIERNAVRLRDLVEDLLILSSYDAEVVRLDRQPVNLAGLARECRDAYLPLAVDKRVELRLLAEPRLPRVLADRAHLDRVVQNLLGNAVKFSRSGGRVTMRLAADADHVVLSVTDTGIGIPAEEQDQVFARFFRSSLSMAGEIQGAGLGLALVQTVVEWHEGTVEMESIEDEGTTVTVRLPTAAATLATS
ncbi:cell wall metabolism sensor histidine kinase WalK [Marmoricola sp. URHB0036]|uniref:sensor histidine kinase n=1 Tax=Marmoricola sp. URHB0036 TaxID=1298863 RepID=UPI00040D47CD|nr:ATP-binding protein [Marmoricola sp. URHB0036]